MAVTAGYKRRVYDILKISDIGLKISKWRIVYVTVVK